jgi:hypothetical protein
VGGGEDEKCKQNFKREAGMGTLKRYRLRWDDNIKMDLKTMGENLYRILLVRNKDTWRVVMKALMKLWVR